MPTVAPSAPPSPVAADLDPLTPAYDALGVEGYYEANGATYRNPHEDDVAAALTQAVKRWSFDLKHVLDLACGSGEVTLALRTLGATDIDGIDPYTTDAYRARTGLQAEAHRFEDIAAGALAGRSWSLVVCSYALHLLETSRLPGVCRALADVTDTLLIISPHKRPVLRPGWGWGAAEEFRYERTRVRCHRRVDTP